jgi:hypothetical protein
VVVDRHLVDGAVEVVDEMLPENVATEKGSDTGRSCLDDGLLMASAPLL